jgi:fucose permease
MIAVCQVLCLGCVGGIIDNDRIPSVIQFLAMPMCGASIGNWFGTILSLHVSLQKMKTKK